MQLRLNDNGEGKKARRKASEKPFISIATTKVP